MSISVDTQSLTLQEIKSQLLTCFNCFCGLCVYRCPAFIETKNEAVTARGLSQICLSLLDGELELSELPDELIYACTNCRWCEWTCAMNTPTYIQHFGTRKTKVSGATMAEILRSMRIEQGAKIPKELSTAGKNLAKVGNPYGEGRKAKDDWVKSLDLSLEGGDTILYTGPLVPYEDNSRRMAEAVVAVLKMGQLQFGMLGSEERESGAFLRMIGAEGLFVEMVEHNTEVFKKRHIRRIICLSPHDYDAFHHYYEDLGNIKIMHYTEVLCEMIEKDKIKLRKKVDKRVTYHDPCYLGRQGGIYDEPRKILKSIPGVQLIEMERSRETAMCCGGGGTGLFLELPNFHIDKVRADQVKAVDPDCVAISCPNCFQMLDAAMKSRDYDIEVKDVSQLVMEAF